MSYIRFLALPAHFGWVWPIQLNSIEMNKRDCYHDCLACQWLLSLRMRVTRHEATDDCLLLMNNLLEVARSFWEKSSWLSVVSTKLLTKLWRIAGNIIFCWAESARAVTVIISEWMERGEEESLNGHRRRHSNRKLQSTRSVAPDDDECFNLFSWSFPGEVIDVESHGL